MGRRSKTRTLNLWTNDLLVGRWTITSTGEHQLHYAHSWLESEYARPISLSLPLKPEDSCYRGAMVRSFFDNLLPDSVLIRQRIQNRFGTVSREPFDLLTEVGRDCVGALQIVPEGKDPVSVKSITYKTVDECEIEKTLELATSDYLFQREGVDDFRFSVAGAQEKHTFLKTGDSWSIPLGATPSTHIFKLPIGDIGNVDLSTSIENEWLCLNLLQAYGISTAKSDIAQFGSKKVLVVERFDRRHAASGDWIIRRPQEDFCQATGISPGHKYECDGGPGMEVIMNTLLHSEEPAGDRFNFFTANILFWLLAAPDGHAKNFSIFLLPGGNYRLTPLYDVVSAYPVMGKDSKQIFPRKLKMAMAVSGVNRHYHWDKIRRDHWITTGQKVGMSSKQVNGILDDIIEMTPSAIEKVKSSIPASFPDEVAETIFQGVVSSLAKIF